MSANQFVTEQNRLRGMYEHTSKLTLPNPETNLSDAIYKIANVAPIPSDDDVLRFAGRTLSSASLLLLCIKFGNGNATLSAHCEKIMVGSMLLDDIVTTLKTLL